ncbi:MAG: hypothetical protein K9G39_08260 [Chlorobium sp.]|uniref:hypothetical protein n=1 Tax=Chlorobium sp. TaxID=1095 RepID=UPI0025C5E9B0|nr:hypothetical protein [Chlorobium sp.]MCF8383567.1 hypothetical protein [Chlorobium sp.]
MDVLECTHSPAEKKTALSAPFVPECDLLRTDYLEKQEGTHSRLLTIVVAFLYKETSMKYSEHQNKSIHIYINTSIWSYINNRKSNANHYKNITYTGDLSYDFHFA